LVLQSGCNVHAELLLKIVAAERTRGAFVIDKLSSRTGLAHDVRVTVARWRFVSDVYNGGAFELAREQHNAAVALFLEQKIPTNSALHVVKVVFAKRGWYVVKPRRHSVIPRAGVRHFVVDGHVPLVGRRPLHCNNAPGYDVKKREAHRCLSVAVGIHQMNGERGKVGRTVLIGRHELNESSEAALDSASGSGSALHVQVSADEHDSGADLKVVVDALDKPAKQMPVLARGAKVAAGVGLKTGLNGSNQLLQQTLQLACDSVCGLGAVRAGRATSTHDVVYELLQQRRQSVQDSS
jgi:hypothetical protein